MSSGSQKKREKKHPPVILITGKRGEGKTSFLLGLIEEIKKTGLSVDGILAIASKENIPESYTLSHLHSGNQIPLSDRRKKSGWIRAGNFYFNPEAIKLGNDILTGTEILRQNLVIIDEIGRLELTGKIWAGSFQWLLRYSERPVIITLRKDIIRPVIRYFKINDYRIIDIELTNLLNTMDLIISKLD